MAKTGKMLVLDIDSSSLGACILEFGEKPILSDVQRVPIGTGATRDPAALLPLLKDALSRLILGYVKKHPGIVGIDIVMASPWFASTVRTLSSTAEKPVKVSQDSVRRIVNEHRRTEKDDKSKVVLEATPIMVLVNGYRTLVRKPVHGKTLSITFYESIADKAVITQMTDTIRTAIAKVPIVWHTTPLAYAETLLRLSDEEHAIVVDIGGEVTDVVVLSHQTVAFAGSIPIGSRSVARAIAGGADGVLGDSMSRLAMFARGELSEKEMQSTAAALTAAAVDWQKSYVAILAEAGNTVPIPHRVFVVGERDELPWFSQVLMGAEIKGQRPLPTVVNADYCAGAVTFGDGGAFDASLVLDALFFHMRNTQSKRYWSTTPVLYSVQ